MSQENQSITAYLLHRTREDLASYDVTPLNVARTTVSTICAAGLLARYYIHLLVMFGGGGEEPREDYTAYFESPVGATRSQEVAARGLSMSAAGVTLFDPLAVQPAYLSLWLFANWLVLSLDMPAYLLRRVIRHG